MPVWTCRNFFRSALAAALVALTLGCGNNAPGTSPSAQTPSSQVAVVDSAVGVWLGESSHRGNEGEFGFVLQEGGVAFLLGRGVNRAEWRRDGDDVRITIQGERGAATIAGAMSGPRLQGFMTAPGMSDSITFMVEQVGSWSVTPLVGGADFVGVWVVLPVGGDPHFDATSLVLQADGFAIIGSGSSFSRGNWRVEGGRAHIHFDENPGHTGGADWSATLSDGKLVFMTDGRPYQAIRQ